MQWRGLKSLIIAMAEQGPHASWPPALPVAERVQTPGPVILPEHWRALAQGQRQAGKLRRMIAVATADYCTVAVFAVASMVCGLSSLPGLFLGIGMAGVAGVEYYGVRRLREARPGTCRTLGFNQLALAVILCAYALWNLHALASGGAGGAIAKTMVDSGVSADDLRGLTGLAADDVAKAISQILYGGLIVAAILAQGGLALYYFLREQYVRNYLKDTPAWVREMQRIMGH